MRFIIFVEMLVISYLTTSIAVRNLGLDGTLQPIENLKDPHVMAVAEFAVADYNLKTSKQLLFSSVKAGDILFQDGKYWELDIQVSSGAIYDAVIFESSAGALNVTLFKLKPHV